MNNKSKRIRHAAAAAAAIAVATYVRLPIQKWRTMALTKWATLMTLIYESNEPHLMIEGPVLKKPTITRVFSC